MRKIGRLKKSEIAQAKAMFLKKQSIAKIAEVLERTEKSIAVALGQSAPRKVAREDGKVIQIDRSLRLEVLKDRKNPAVKVSFYIGLEALRKLLK